MVAGSNSNVSALQAFSKQMSISSFNVVNAIEVISTKQLLYVFKFFLNILLKGIISFPINTRILVFSLVDSMNSPAT